MTIKLRRDTAANWTSANPTLADGQPGYDQTNNQLRIGDGTTAWTSLTALGGGGGVSDGDKGDITVSGSGATWTIDNGVVTLAKQADVASGTVFYRKTSGTGAPEVQTLATLKTDLGLTGTNSGDQTSIVGITGTKAEFNTAVTDGNIQWVGDAPTAHTHTASEISDSTAAGQAMLTAADAAAQTALLDVFTDSLDGLAPASGGGTTNFLRADGTWAEPPGGGDAALGWFV
jgi:hypothetical protein